LSETKQESKEDNLGVDARLQVNDVAQKLRTILQKKGPSEEEMDQVQLTEAETADDVIQID